MATVSIGSGTLVGTLSAQRVRRALRAYARQLWHALDLIPGTFGSSDTYRRVYLNQNMAATAESRLAFVAGDIPCHLPTSTRLVAGDEGSVLMAALAIYDRELYRSLERQADRKFGFLS
jgi:hypothetical protein